MSSGDAYWQVVDKVWDDISIYDGPQPFLQQFNSVSDVPRTLFAAHWCQSEVRNGGFHQFFHNSTGVLAPEAADAYRTIRMPRLAAVTEKAMQWFGDEYPRERNVRQALLEAYGKDNPDEWNPFEKIDDQFFKLIESENGGFEVAADKFANANSA